MANLWDFIFGSEDKLKKIETGTPQQNAFHGNILSQLQQMMQQGGGYNQAQNYWQNMLQPGQEGFDQFSQPYMQQFEEQVLPQIAERFAGAGALSSSGFGQALGGAASGMQGQLAQLFSQLQQQAAQGLSGQFNQLSQQGLNYQPFAYNKQKGQMGLLPTLGYGLANSYGQQIGNSGGQFLNAALQGGLG